MHSCPADPVEVLSRTAWTAPNWTISSSWSFRLEDRVSRRAQGSWVLGVRLCALWWLLHWALLLLSRVGVQSEKAIGDCLAGTLLSTRSWCWRPRERFKRGFVSKGIHRDACPAVAPRAQYSNEKYPLEISLQTPLCWHAHVSCASSRYPAPTRTPTDNMATSRVVTAVVSVLLLAAVAFVALSPDEISSGAEVTSSQQLDSVGSTTELKLEPSVPADWELETD